MIEISMLFKEILNFKLYYTILFLVNIPLQNILDNFKPVNHVPSKWVKNI